MKANLSSVTRGAKSCAGYMLRMGTSDDAEALARLEANVFDPSIYPLINLRQFRYLLDRGNASVIVAEKAGEIVGSLVLLFRKNSNAARIYSIAVHPHQQGGSIGKAMFDYCEEVAAGLGLKRMLIEIRADNQRHLERYLARGYRLLATLADYYPDHQAGLKLEKHLMQNSGEAMP